MSLRFAVLPRPWFGLLSILTLGFGFVSVVSAQTPPLRLQSLSAGGLRLSVTESSGVLEFTVDNPTAIDRQGRLLAFYETDPDVHYGKDFWIPANSRLAGSMLFGPAPKAGSNQARNIQYLLYDRTDGTEQLIRPSGEEVRRSRALLYQSRMPTTVLFLDEIVDREPPLGELPKPVSLEQEAVQFVQLLRASQELPPNVSRVFGRQLPATPEAFAGIDLFVLASPQLANDPVGIRAMRHWVRQGGSLWVMLDRTHPELLSTLLEDALDFHSVGRQSLDQFTVESYPKSAMGGKPTLQRHDRPVDFVRVVLPEGERPTLSLDGWPVLFTRKLGQGNVIFTTLGPRATYRERTLDDSKKAAADPRRSSNPNDEAIGRLPIPNDLLRLMGQNVRKPPPKQPFLAQQFNATLGSQIGYHVVGVSTIALIFGGFLLAELFLGWWFSRIGKSMLLLWLTPLTAVATAAVFLLLGESSRKVEPTIAVGQVVNALENRNEVSIHGLMAVYRPESGKLIGSAEGGGSLEMDRKGLDGQIGRRVMTDLDAWHWENLSTPAGIRLAPFKYIAPTPEPIKAVFKLTNAGLEGTLHTGGFRNVSDAVFCGPGDRRSMVVLGANGSAEVRAAEMLPANQYFATTTVSDRQQRRLELVREFIKSDEFTNLKRETLILAWADPSETPFNRGSEARKVGDALLMIPVRFERPTPGTRFTLPASCLPFTRVLDGITMAVSRETDRPTDLRLRFQLPPELLPMKVTDARFTARISAPSREIVVKGGTGPKLTELHRVSSPLNAIRVEITDPSLLALDAEGGLSLNVTISDLLEPPADPTRKPFWKIEYLELEVSGETLP